MRIYDDGTRSADVKAGMVSIVAGGRQMPAVRLSVKPAPVADARYLSALRAQGNDPAGYRMLGPVCVPLALAEAVQQAAAASKDAESRRAAAMAREGERAREEEQPEEQAALKAKRANRAWERGDEEGWAREKF